jgi:ubiquinone/menaquinone biosynthesis C-methylase UbiE
MASVARDKEIVVGDPVGTQAQHGPDQAPRRPFYAGATLHVRSYDSINAGDGPAIRGDARFYLDLARRAGGEVLEIAVGTGRVALQLAAAGMRVTGVDASDAMLAIAAEKTAGAGVADRVRLERADMRTFRLAGAEFALAIVPFRAFQVLLTPEDQLATLAAIRRHLRPDGCLVLHLFDPNLRLLLPGAPAPIERQVGVDRDTGRPVEGVLEAAELDHVNQVRRDLWRYRAFAADGTVAEEQVLELSLRWTFRWEMRHLLRIAGFAIEAEFSDFAGAGPAYGKEQIWVARRGS